MKQYYYASGDQQLGPFTIEELKSKNLNKDVYVWYEGLSDWTRAGDLPELSSLFEVTYDTPQQPTVNPTPPPPANTGYQQPQNQGGYQQQYQQPQGVKPKTWLVESILSTLFCCLPAGIAGIVFASKVDTLWAQGDIAGAEKASKDAKLWTTISFGVGLVFIVLYMIVVIGGALSGF